MANFAGLLSSCTNCPGYCVLCKNNCKTIQRTTIEQYPGPLCSYTKDLTHRWYIAFIYLSTSQSPLEIKLHDYHIWTRENRLTWTSSQSYYLQEILQYTRDTAIYPASLSSLSQYYYHRNSVPFTTGNPIRLTTCNLRCSFLYRCIIKL